MNLAPRKNKMKIKKIIVDKKPKECMLCPIKNSTVRVLEDGKCGVQVTRMDKPGWPGWKSTGMEPDERCLFVEEENNVDN